MILETSAGLVYTLGMLNQKILAAFVILGALSSCDQLGPIATRLQAHEEIRLRADSGRPVTLSRGAAVDADFLWRSDNKKAVIELLGESVTFRNATVNSAKDAVTSLPSESGQNSNDEDVGIEGRRELVCQDSRCESVVTYLRDRQCTRYERRPYRRCWRDRYGRVYCENGWEDVPVSGWERVEVTETTRQYRYTVRLFGEKTALLADGETVRPETTTSERAVSACY